jgi:hypothetical protein
MGPIDVGVYDAIREVDFLQVVDKVEGRTKYKTGQEYRDRKMRLLRLDKIPNALFCLLLSDTIRNERTLLRACVFDSVGKPVLVCDDSVCNGFR